MESITIISNIGSASKKYSVYQGEFEIAWFHYEKSKDDFLCSYKIHSIFEKKHITEDQYKNSIVHIFELIQKSNIVKSKEDVASVAIRTVVPHEDFISDTLCTPEVLQHLIEIQTIDPVHIAPVIEEVQQINDFFGAEIQIYFISDSKFHLSTRRKIPLNFQKPMYTIGYHGLSCESVLSFLEQYNIPHKQLVVAHLGGGSSVSGIRKNISVYNSMEVSPLGGVVMSSRCGSIDPFALLYYMKENNLSYEQMLDHMYTQSGIKSLSGVSNDLRVVKEEAFKGNQDAKNAVLQYIDSIAEHICKALVHTQGVDTLVFTGTIGFRAPWVREMVIEKLLWLGCVLDHSKNLDSGDVCFEVSAYNSKIKIIVIQVDEMKQMYKHAQVFSKKIKK